MQSVETRYPLGLNGSGEDGHRSTNLYTLSYRPSQDFLQCFASPWIGCACDLQIEDVTSDESPLPGIDMGEHDLQCFSLQTDTSIRLIVEGTIQEACVQIDSHHGIQQATSRKTRSVEKQIPRVEDKTATRSPLGSMRGIFGGMISIYLFG